MNSVETSGPQDLESGFFFFFTSQNKMIPERRKRESKTKGSHASASVRSNEPALNMVHGKEKERKKEKVQQ